MGFFERIAAMLDGSARRPIEYTQWLDEVILADDWLMHCANNAEQYVGCFDSWWRLSIHHEGVREEFGKAHPTVALPGKDEIGQRVRQLRENHRVDIVGNSLVRRTS